MVDRFQFYIHSKDIYPGRGVGECVSNESVYHELSQIKGWRRIFSSLWDDELLL